MLNIKYNKKNTVIETWTILEKGLREGLKNLMFTYADCRKVEPSLPELWLSGDIIEAMMRDREDTKFRMTLIRLMVEVKSNNREKVLGLISLINSYT
jgi:hypothetical protein